MEISYTFCYDLYMRSRFIIFAVLVSSAVLTGCGTAYRIPYLSLDLRETYTRSDITVNYTYVCEYDDQRCVYNLYNNVEPSVSIAGDDAVLPQSGQITFTGLAEGSYRLDFTVYSEREGEYYALKFLDESYDFSIDLP